ncbi:MAG: Ig-like domain-containing protein, partial [Dysgonamonadaceae bacterium]|nr:Ig-like domain-containing protein [Dysgonamonadaceae bacterium]
KRVGAGDILYRNGVFHIYFNGIGHSYSGKPAGMYKEQCINEPFDERGIDVQVFQDEDGSLYYIKKVNPGDPHPLTGANYPDGAKIWTFKMDSPFVRKGISGKEQMRHQKGHPSNIDWENFEGPELFRYRDTYIMMYSPNRMSARTGMYLIGAAQSDSAMNFNNSKKYPQWVLGRNMESHHFIYNQLLHTAEHGGWTAKYRTAQPAGDWTSPGFDDSAWTSGTGGFGLKEMDIARVRSNRTIWSSNAIYIRRHFTLDAVPAKLALKYRVEANAEFYVNGVKLNFTPTNSQAYVLQDIDASLFRAGENVIAVKAENSCSGDDCFKFIDFGLFDTRGNNAEKLVIGQSQANYVIGPGGFERWIMYKGFFNGVSSQGIDRMHFYDKELVVEPTSSLYSPGYHPQPAMPTFIHYFDYKIPYPFRTLAGEWTIANGLMSPKTGQSSESLLITNPMTHYRFEVPFRIFNGSGETASVYAFYQDENNFLKINIHRDSKTWTYEIKENGISTIETQSLPEKFAFLEDDPLVALYEEPWHTLTVYKNADKFRVELDYFNLTLDGAIDTGFAGAGSIGLAASSDKVSFDAVQYTQGWDEWDEHVSGWQAQNGTWTSSPNGLEQTDPQGKNIALKGDTLYNYEFSAMLKNTEIPASGSAGFYPVYVDENNWVEAGIDYRTGQLQITKKTNGTTESNEFPLFSHVLRQFTFEAFPATDYRYDFRSETEISGLNILWCEGYYPYLAQTFDLPEAVKIYALQDGSWVELNAQLEGELRFAWFNHFRFAPVRTKAIRLALTPRASKAVRAFSACFDENLSADYYLRARRENDKLYIWVNDSLKATLAIDFPPAKTGLFTENLSTRFNGILHYQTGKIAVKTITIPPLSCAVGQTIELSATVEPFHATNKHLVWETSDANIASIDRDNRLTRHASGNVTVTAWTADGGLVKASCLLGEATRMSEKKTFPVEIFPNPTKDKLLIRSEWNGKNGVVAITDLTGKVILTAAITANEQTLDVDHLAPGSYL